MKPFAVILIIILADILHCPVSGQTQSKSTGGYRAQLLAGIICNRKSYADCILQY